MSAARTARRRRKQMVNGYRHLAKLGRPIYRRHALLSVADAIARERELARRQQSIKKKA